ncbi:Cubilin [Frankliniella fusca]|uniref:Cubilin n=1 Tax=Frankliniella fusca TaxID=407009 RepID=A0AAE1HHK1_9NEOP|nr:Cubilin [Frankliniella fusca]
MSRLHLFAVPLALALGLLAVAALAGAERQERFFPLLGFGFGPPPRAVPNTPCFTTNNLNGTCSSRRNCAGVTGGVPAGDCARGLGVCCVVSLSCGTTSSANFTYFTNPGYPGTYPGGGRCTITINKCAGVDQLRLDFLDLTLAQPDANGVCRSDFLSITGASFAYPRICGVNAGNHMYVDFPAGTNSVVLSVDTDSTVRFARVWNIRITQIEATNPSHAPPGCLQYYQDTTGSVTSFNYGTTAATTMGATPIGTREIANLDYMACVRPAAGYCSIEWSQLADDPYSFTVSGDTSVLDATTLGTAFAALSGITAATATQAAMLACDGDYVIIPSAIQNQVYTVGDRFCGNGFVTTTSVTKPFWLGVHTNNTESGFPPTILPDIANRGFSLTYRQLPCPIF